MCKHLFNLLVLLILVGCGGATSPGHTADEPASIDSAELIDMHNSRISIDWAGSYLGILPCADCQGIKTEITLFEDHTYKMVTQYVGKDEQLFHREGTFAWDDTGGIIALTDVDPMHETNLYRVGENRLFKLDKDGERIRGDLEMHYILEKVN
jgi:copper homeostasis protein (lipoprotein)